MKQLALLLLLIFGLSCTPPPDLSNAAVSTDDERATRLMAEKERLVPFFQPMRVEEDDWLDSFQEDGETFEQYLRSSPTLPTPQRKTIYIQPIGKFTLEQRTVIELTAEYMKAFFDLPVTLRPESPLGKVPVELFRVQYPDNTQIRTTYFLDTVLPGLLPDDAAALICFTNYDLYPSDTWNYVFGQASLNARIGVWSLWRLERDGEKKAARELFLGRTLKVAMHETGHMFSMRHCTKYECLMSGTNHLNETDRRPLDTCPECTAKIGWAMDYPLEKRYRRLEEFWRSQDGWAHELGLTRSKLGSLTGRQPQQTFDLRHGLRGQCQIIPAPYQARACGYSS